DVYAVAVDIVVLDNHVRDVEAHAKRDAAVGWLIGFLLSHCMLHVDRSLHCGPCALENRQETVAGILDDLALPLRDNGLHDRKSQIHQPRMRARSSSSIKRV